MKFIVALNKKCTLPAQVNAAGHLCLGMPKLLGTKDIMLREFRDSNNVKVSLLSDHPLIILSAKNSNHLRDAHCQALEDGVMVHAFFECHRDASPTDQERQVQNSTVSDQDYVGVSMFGSDEVLRTITKRFSLL